MKSPPTHSPTYTVTEQ